IAHLRYKESNRIDDLALQFTNLGVDIKKTEDSLTINGPSTPQGIADAMNDHRLAMALTILGIKSEEGITITGAECITKSYPDFFGEIKKIGANIT
ncbi:MAG: 3-phosphoshikimate 1-carboxyvinyltransferase, partial [Candidatus Ranarchaeia archaeon]